MEDLFGCVMPRYNCDMTVAGRQFSKNAVLHAKMMVVDDHWVTIGSFNVNNVSAYASLEMNFDVRNKPFASSVQQLLNSIIEKDCIQVTKKSPVFNTTVFRKFIQKSSYDLIRVILNLSTFYFKQE